MEGIDLDIVVLLSGDCAAVCLIRGISLYTLNLSSISLLEYLVDAKLLRALLAATKAAFP